MSGKDPQKKIKPKVSTDVPYKQRICLKSGEDFVRLFIRSRDSVVMVVSKKIEITKRNTTTDIDKIY